MRNIICNNHSFMVNVIIKKNNKNIYLRVKKGYLEITTPYNLSDDKIKNLINKNFNCIIKLYDTKTNINEDIIHYLGVKYDLVLKKSDNDLVYINNNQFIVEYKNERFISKNINMFYFDSLVNIVNQYKNDIFSKFNLKNVLVDYTNVKTFFGKCYPKQNKIVLNIRLAKYDIKYILSVIYHECAHFKYQNHQSEYYKYLESIYPNYRLIQKELRSIKYNEKY